MKMDNTDRQILDLLTQNAKLTYQEIGKVTHLTGQAVGARVNKLIELGIIKNFTINVNKDLLGINTLALIKIFMKTPSHARLKTLIDTTPQITEAYRVSGDGCYFLKVETDSNQLLNLLLDEINVFATYQLSISVNQLK